MSKIISQGAEAIIKKEKNCIIKDRIKKSYRIKEIDDKIRRLRTRNEGKILQRASKIIPTPQLINSNEDSKQIKMDFIPGKVLSLQLDKLKNKEQENIASQIGKNIALLHNNKIIHGDLTTSNMIYHNQTIYVIDFGLAFQSERIEDKAVDLHLLKQALGAKHYLTFNKLWKTLEKSYKKNSEEGDKVLQRLKIVESRGRYKDKY